MDEVRWNCEWTEESFLPQGLLSLMKAIADTGFIVAFKNRADQHHSWAVDLARQVEAPLLTCESVLSEAAFHVGSSEAILELLRAGMLQLDFDCGENIDRLQNLASQYADRHPDFADLCIIRMSELHPHHSVLTVDDDFRIYRRHKREVIPVLCPVRK